MLSASITRRLAVALATIFLVVLVVWAVSDTRTAGTGANVAEASNPNWLNPGNITADDGTASTTTLGTDVQSDWLYASNFGFSIPGGNEIKGIEFTSERQKSGAGDNCLDSAVHVVKGGSRVGSNHADNNFWPTTFTNITYGAPNDLWLASPWTMANVNASDFGVQIQAVGNTTTFDVVCLVDVVTATVTYGPPATKLLITQNRRGRVSPKLSFVGR